LKLLVLGLLLLQFGPRPPAFGVAQASPERSRGALTPAETLLEPELLRTIQQASAPSAATDTPGSDAGSDILLACKSGQCAAATRAAQKLNALVAAKTIPQPLRSIRMVSAVSPSEAARAKTVIHVAELDRPFQIIRGLWSHAAIGDEVAEIFARRDGILVDARPYEDVGQLALEAYGVPTTTIVSNPSMSNDHAANVAAAAAYFLATLPNAGAEALLAHLTVGAHARLAEDGRRAVAQMGNQQRASADVLIMFGQAIEREQRRMRSFERFMPEPVDPMLRSRIADMEKGITTIWTSIGITSSPFVPPAQRIRGRGGEDLRIPARVGNGPIKPVEPPVAFLKFDAPALIVHELGNFIDGKRSISDIRDAVSAEFGPLPVPSVTDYFDRLARSGAISIK
jgi:hypothetical protein